MRIAASEAQFDGSGSELGGDLFGSRPEGIDEHQADRCVKRREQAIGGTTDVVSTDLGGGGELALEAVDVGCELHDASMTSS